MLTSALDQTKPTPKIDADTSAAQKKLKGLGDEGEKAGEDAGEGLSKGIIAALEILGEKATKPIVVRLDGNAVEIGRHILTEAANPLVTMELTMDSAARKAAELASTN